MNRRGSPFSRARRDRSMSSFSVVGLRGIAVDAVQGGAVDAQSSCHVCHRNADGASVTYELPYLVAQSFLGRVELLTPLCNVSELVSDPLSTVRRCDRH